ncbi:MAG: DUF4336 domain-containing protein [bacterium]|nr:DUF4336 domain-containing protein [bacterium]
MAVGELIKVDEDLYCLEHAQNMPGGVYFPTRMSVIRLKGGGLWLHSPVPIDDSMAAQIEQLGPVLHVVAPNHFHHMYVAAVLDRWPDARFWFAPGLDTKVPEFAERGEPLHDDSASAAAIEWRGEIDCVQIQGAPNMNEVVFFHQATGSLVLADLVFHWGAPCGPRQWLLFTIMDVANGLRQSRMWRLITKDRKAAANSCEKIYAWPIQRIVPCHGEVYENATPQILRAAVLRFQ